MIANNLKLKPYGWYGLCLICFAEAAIVLHQMGSEIAHAICIWAIPLCMAGYLMFMDSLVYKIKGHSLIYNRRKEFCLQLLLSLIFSIILEIYNFQLKDWQYIGLPDSRMMLFIGISVTFAATMTFMMLTFEFLEALRLFDRFKVPKLKVDRRILYAAIVSGAFLLALPFFIGKDVVIDGFLYMFAGSFLFFEPIVYLRNGDSLLKDLEKGKPGRLYNLFIASLIWGFLCEFWNYWATVKWIYPASFSPEIKLFEISLFGFFGYAPLALGYFSLYNFCKLFIKNKEMDVV